MIAYIGMVGRYALFPADNFIPKKEILVSICHFFQSNQADQEAEILFQYVEIA